eukprot:10991010-Ditylum_brightwellii.AAC.1
MPLLDHAPSNVPTMASNSTLVESALIPTLNPYVIPACAFPTCCIAFIRWVVEARGKCYVEES